MATIESRSLDFNLAEVRGNRAPKERSRFTVRQASAGVPVNCSESASSHDAMSIPAPSQTILTTNDSVHRQAGAEASTIVAKRLVFHLGGYDPITPYVVAQRRFVRELARFERTWSTKASMGALEENVDQAKWSVITKGPNWQV